MSAQTAPVLVTASERRISLLVIHCSATPSGQRIGPPTETAAGVIDRWHAARGFQRGFAARSRFNWRLPAIGYHFVVDLDGTVWTGRHPDEVGAHVRGFNQYSLGVCLVGGAERDARYTPLQWDALRQLVLRLCAEHGVPARYPLYPRQAGGVCGHRDLSPDTDGDGSVRPHEWLKTCPGFDVSRWLENGLHPAPEHVLEGPAR